MGTTTVHPQTLTPTTITTKTTTTIPKTGNLELPIHPVTHVAKRITPWRDTLLEPMQQTDRLHGIKTGTAEPISTKLHPKPYQEECPRLNSTSKQEKPPLHSKAATGRPVTPMEILLLMPEVV